MRLSRVALSAVLGVAVLTSCSSGGTTSGGSEIKDVAKAKSAVIQIVAQGSFVSPETGQRKTSAGTGSGFIIDPSGIAVTNQHVVDGAGSLEVYVGGSKDAINAKILGVSECNDLAVIDLAGDGFDYFKWYDGTLEPGIPVFAAGFPLGDPEYTLTDGIVAKARANGDYVWASIEYAIEHSANIQPGNSGGPLLTKDGRVVAVNFAGGSPTQTAQFFAIPAAVARPVVDVLAQGSDQDSIGINGEALWNDADAIGGLWVSGVRAGSPAANAGVQSGDIVLQLQGRDVVNQTDLATKKGYCDVLRTNGSDKPMSISVYRSSTGETLAGEVNNPQRLLVTVSKPGQSATDEGGDTTEVQSADGDLVSKTDEWKLVDMMVPRDWEFNSQSGETNGTRYSATCMTPGSLSSSVFGICVYVYDGIFEDLVLSDIESQKTECKTFEKLDKSVTKWDYGVQASAQSYDCFEKYTGWFMSYTNTETGLTITFYSVYEADSTITASMVNKIYESIVAR